LYQSSFRLASGQVSRRSQGTLLPLSGQPKVSNPWNKLLTQNLYLAPSTQQAEQASFTREEITRRASQFSLKINKRDDI
jgi:hypothetical protein